MSTCIVNVFWILALVLLLASANSAPAVDDFILSYWCGVKSSSDLEKGYAEVKDCGFNYAFTTVDFWHTTVETNIQMMDACQKQGIRCVILDLRIFNVKPESADFEKTLDDIVDAYSKHPAFAGYWLADEPGTSDFARLTAIREYLGKKDPKHFSYVNLLPALAAPEKDYVERFCRQFKPEILSYDNYVLQTGKTDLEPYFYNLGLVRKSALAHKIPACNIIQAIAGGAWRDPTEAEYRWQVNTSLAYGFKSIMYFYYWTPPLEDGGYNDNGILDSNGVRTHRYQRVRRVNHTINAMAPILMQLTSTAVYHTGNILRGSQPYPFEYSELTTPIDMYRHDDGDKWSKAKRSDSNFLIGQVSGGPLVIGMFRHKDGGTWAMVVNRDFANDTRAHLRFADTVKGVQMFMPSLGTMRDINLKDHKSQIDLRAGDGVLLKLIR